MDHRGLGRSGPPGTTPDDGSLAIPLSGFEVLVLRGPGLTAEDRDILAAFAAQLATALESDRLHAEAAEADSLARANQLRSALLAAVSHDLRTPLASIKAAASGLLSDQLEFGPDETGILLHTIDDEADRLSAQGVFLATMHYDKPEPVNLGSGMEISIHDLATTIAGLTGFNGRIVWDTTKPNGQPRRCLDVTRAVREFNFRASTPFETGLRKTIEWYLSSTQRKGPR